MLDHVQHHQHHRERHQRGQRGPAHHRGRERQHHRRRHDPGGRERSEHHPARVAEGQQIQSAPAVQQPHRGRAQRPAGIGHRLAEAHRHRDHRGRQRQVPVLEDPADHVPARVGDGDGVPHGIGREDEVLPPEPGRDGERGRDRDEFGRVEANGRRARADPDDRLPERHQQEQGEPLRHVRRVVGDGGQLAAEHHRPGQVAERRQRPEADPRPLRQQPARHQQRPADQHTHPVRPAPDPRDARQQEQQHHPGRPVPGAEQHAPVPVRAGNRQRHDQAGEPDGQDAQPVARGVHVADVGLHGGADPAPVDRDEHHQRLRDPERVVAVVQQAGDLGDREDEDQVEVQLRPGDPLLRRLPGLLFPLRLPPRRPSPRRPSLLRPLPRPDRRFLGPHRKLPRCAHPPLLGAHSERARPGHRPGRGPQQQCRG